MARKILLADDSVTAQNMGRKILADAGYDVSTVNNGSAALKRIAEVKPDLIVLDVYMPGYSGLEVCQRLKDSDETAHIPVLLTVGKLEPFKPEEARRVRADAHIVKPFEASELLTAITRLEDRMVPQSDGTRFSNSVSGVERFGGEAGGRKTDADANADTGWKSRLRFPSKKKKEEPEPEEVAESVPFRDFRKGKGKAGAAFSVKAPPPPGQEPGLVPDIPRDITPDELDALSALVAKLDGPIPAVENITSLADKTEIEIKTETSGVAAAEMTAEIAAVKTAAAKTEAAKTEVEAPAVAAEAEKKKEEKLQAEIPAPVEPLTAAVPAPALGVEMPAAVAEAKSEIEIPVEHLEPASEAPAVVANPAGEIHQPDAETRETQGQETKHSETLAVIQANAGFSEQAPIPVDHTPLVQAHVGQTDEPTFSSAAHAAEPIAEALAESEVSALTEAAVEKNLVAKSPEPEIPELNTEEAKPEEPKPAELKALESKTPELKTENAELASPVTASVPAAVESEELAASDAELAEALRLLTPATGVAEGPLPGTLSGMMSGTMPSHGTLVAAGQLLAEEAARNAAAGPRWIAEPVALSPEETALSLEAEMFRTFAATPTATANSEREVRRITGVSAIAAAVESRLAEAGLAAISPDSKQADERSSESTAGQEPDSKAMSSLVEEAVPEPSELQKIEPQKIAAEKSATKQREESPAQVTEEAPDKEVAAATFADAVGNDADATAQEQNQEQNEDKLAKDRVEPARVKAAEVAADSITDLVSEENRDLSSDFGGEESMGKDGKGKSNWHQIRNAPTGAAPGSNAVEAAKQAAAESEEAPKAMAAAASADGSGSVTDAGTIASIVDSVMADLRPKIVEEIAKKLAGK